MVCSASVLAGAIGIYQTHDASSRLRIASRRRNPAVGSYSTFRTLHATIAKRSTRCHRAIHRYGRRGTTDTSLRCSITSRRVVSAEGSASRAIGAGRAWDCAIVSGRFAHVARGTVTADGAFMALAEHADRGAISVNAVSLGQALNAAEATGTTQWTAIARETAADNRA
jgi:hypothetical protein